MTNPLLTPSTLPYGLPEFDAFDDAHFHEALTTALQLHRDEIDAIAHSPEPATFENTVVALMESGAELDRVAAVFYTKVSADTNDHFNALREEFSPKFAAHGDYQMLNADLFARVHDLFLRKDTLGLDDVDLYALEQLHRKFVQAGAEVSVDQQAELKELNGQISRLQTDFSNRLLADTNDSAVIFDTVEELDGLSEEQIQTAAAAATERGLEGKYLLGLILPTDQPCLEYLTQRESRRRVHEASVSRGRRGNEYDTRDIVLELVKARARRAQLLGFEDHASLAADLESAGTSQAIKELLYPLAAPASQNMQAEAAALQEVIDREAADNGTEPFELAAWDWQYYTAKLRREKFDVDVAALRPYFELNRVLHDGVFYAANRLYGFTFTPREDLRGYHESVTVFEVADDDGPVGLFLFDPYTRDSKRGGAWMNCLVEQSHYRDTKPVVCNNLNVVEPVNGPTLLSLDEVQTLFHEFGHALHAFCSDVRYTSTSGTNVPRDFVEYPSQVNEMWHEWPDVIENYARHVETDEPIPAEVLTKLSRLGTFNQGYFTFTMLSAMLLDQEWHKLTPQSQVDDVEEFEAKVLESVGMSSDIVDPRYRSTYFSHTFGGGYDARYYGYLWSQVLDADTVEWFRSNGGLTRDNGARLRQEVLAPGGSRDPLESFRAFMGRAPKVEPLLERLGMR